MRPYELVVLLHPDLEIDVDAPLAKIDALVAAVEGKVTKRDNWGKKRLAYSIKRQQFAVYIYYELQLDPDKIRQLENSLLITDEVIRQLLVSKLEVAAREPRQNQPKVAAAAESEQ